MTREETLWKTYNQLTSNNARAINVIRMVRALLPDEQKSQDDYNFYEVLGVVQDVLQQNWDVLDRQEEVLMELDSIPSTEQP